MKTKEKVKIKHVNMVWQIKNNTINE